MTVQATAYKALKKLSEAGGYNLVLTKKAKKNELHEVVSPSATYAPWLDDRAFSEVYQKAQSHTLVDKYRCYELWQLVAEVAKLRGALLEVGVWRGGSAAIIAKQAKLHGIKDQFYLCDTFTGVVKASEKDTTYKNAEHADASKDIVERLLRDLKLENTKILVGIFPDQTSSLATAKEFRFCHIDVDVYQSAKDTVEWIWPKLVVGGMIVFDDYGFKDCDGITQFVNEERKKSDRLVIHNLNGHAIIIKLAATKRT